MSEYTKHLTPRPELRERIIETAVEAFSAHGIKSIMNVRMLPKWQSLNCQIALQACFGTLYAGYKT